MSFEIFSIGDAAFLAAVLNAVAMLSGSGQVAVAAGVGATLGVLLTFVRGLIQYDARGIRYQDLLASLLLYLALFVPVTTFTIEDAYTGQVRVVDNVPLGPAAAGSILSNLGYRLTRLFEQGFGTPSMTEHGFTDTLQVMTLVRKHLLSRIELGKANAPNAGGDLETSLVNYVKECTLTGVDLGLLRLDGILRHPQVLTAIRFESEVYTTEIQIGGAARIETCSDAWTHLDTYVKTLAVPAVDAVLAAALNLTSPDGVEPRLDEALTVLTAGSVSAQDYMLAALITPMFEKGVIGRHEDGLKWNKAAMVEQAIQQRNAQWAGEQTLFTRIVRPMLTWIEGFSYAITPLTAFTVLLGARGIQMTGQYLLMLLWIQLWMPILAVVNLYVTLAASAQLAALDTAQFNLPSIAGLYQMDQAIQEWLGVGGMLAASTPAIALMLVYGGSVTATHFLGRMQGGDFINEKITSPDLVSPAPLLNLQPSFQHAPLSGTTAFGASQVLPSFQAGRDLSAAVASASVALQQASHTFLESLSNTASHSRSLTREGFDARSTGQRIASSSSQTDQFLRATGEDFAQRYRDTGLSGDEFAAVVGGSAGLSQKAAKASVAGQLQNQFRVSQSRADEIASDISQKVSNDQRWQTDLARSVAADAQSGTREVAALGLQQQDLRSLQQSATDTVSASETYTQTHTAQQRFGTSASYGAAETGRRIAADASLQAALDTRLDQFGLRGDTQRLAAQWRTAGLIVDPDQAFAAAGMSLLAGYAAPSFRRLDAQDARQAGMAAYQLLGETWNTPVPDKQHPDRSAGLGGKQPSFGQTQTEVRQANLRDPASATRNLDGRVSRQINTRNGRISQGEYSVTTAHQAGLATVHQADQRETATLRDAKSAHLVELMRTTLQSQPSAAELEYDVIGGAIYSSAQNIAGIGATAQGAVGAFVRQFETARSQGHTLGESFEAAFRAAPEGGGQALDAWADQRVAQTSQRLTPTQKAFYRAAMFDSFAGTPMFPADYPGSAVSQQLLRTLKAEHGEEVGEHIGELLRRAAGQNRGDLVDLVGAFNQTAGKGK